MCMCARFSRMPAQAHKVGIKVGINANGKAPVLEAGALRVDERQLCGRSLSYHLAEAAGNFGGQAACFHHEAAPAFDRYKAPSVDEIRNCRPRYPKLRTGFFG